MSYSSERKKSMEAFLRKIEKNAVDPAMVLTAEQITKDLSDTFDKCIDDFYMYETRRYYRHETGRGTGTGWNLYLANQFRVNYSGKIATSIHFGWNGNDMATYKSLSKGGNVDREHVLDSVMNGIRFNGDGSSYYPEMSWTLSSPISTEYFGTISGSTPDIIFEQMLNKMFSVQYKLSRKNFNMIYKQYKAKKK